MVDQDLDLHHAQQQITRMLLRTQVKNLQVSVVVVVVVLLRIDRGMVKVHHHGLIQVQVVDQVVVEQDLDLHHAHQVITLEEVVVMVVMEVVFQVVTKVVTHGIQVVMVLHHIPVGLSTQHPSQLVNCKLSFTLATHNKLAQVVQTLTQDPHHPTPPFV